MSHLPKGAFQGLRSLLIVEDVPEMREWLAEIFRQECPGLQVQVAENGGEFHIRVGRIRPDLILLDEVLGVGEDVASLLKVAEQMTLSVILMTGMLQNGFPQKRGLPSPAVARVQKPSWERGEGVDAFLEEVHRAWALTGASRQG